MLEMTLKRNGMTKNSRSVVDLLSNCTSCKAIFKPAKEEHAEEKHFNSKDYEDTRAAKSESEILKTDYLLFFMYLIKINYHYELVLWSAHSKLTI